MGHRRHGPQPREGGRFPVRRQRLFNDQDISQPPALFTDRCTRRMA